MNQELSNKIHLLIRSEKALFKLEMQKKGRQVVLTTIAVLAILASLATLNLAFYLYFETMLTPLGAAATLSVVNLVIAIIFFVLASQQGLSKEAESIHEVREYALNELSLEYQHVKEEATEIRNSFSKVSAGFSAVKALAPLIQMFVHSRKKGK